MTLPSTRSFGPEKPFVMAFLTHKLFSVLKNWSLNMFSRKQNVFDGLKTLRFLIIEGITQNGLRVCAGLLYIELCRSLIIMMMS